MMMTPDTEESIRCTVSCCSCAAFRPGSVKVRSCNRCGHGWVLHALEKLQAQASSSCGPVEVALPGLVFDLSSLVLYGAQAIPVQLKILLDRLYSVLTTEQVGHILHTLGWSLGDYVRGYMLQFPSGKVLDRWTMVTAEEELLILKQFLRFGETRTIVELMTLQCLAAVSYLSDGELNPTSKSCLSNTGSFAEHRGRTPGTARRPGDLCLVTAASHFEKAALADHSDILHHFENFPGGLSLLLPFHFPSSAFQCLVSPTKDLVPRTKLNPSLQKPNGTKLAERPRQTRGRATRESDPILQQSKVEGALEIKADPDWPSPAPSLWHLNPHIGTNRDFDRRRGMAKQESISSPSPSSNSSFIPMSSSLHLPLSSSSSSPPKIYQKMRGSSPSSFHPLPSFSSSFLCPLPAPSFSSSLHPLPSTPCSLPSSCPSGGRKGRVCCGVCGKSFYDKGTLKIHYNAVHLKIKHRCTVAGCTMVFSSLRSRNRHSANPNPRLHTGVSRDVHTHRNTHSESQKRGKEIDNNLCQQDDDDDDDAHTLAPGQTLRKGLNSCTNPHQHNLSPPRPLVSDTSHNQSDPADKSDLQPQVLPPPHTASFLRSSPCLMPLVVPVAEQTEPSQHLLNTNHTEPAPPPDPVSFTCSNQCGCSKGERGEVTNQQRQWESDPIPKKKPRKSSTPVKIDRELEGMSNSEEEQF